MEHLVTLVICWKFQKISLKSAFIHFFFMILYMYIAGAGADSPQGTKFWCQQQCLVTLCICCNFQKMSFKSDWYYFLHDLIHVYSPGEGQTAPRGQNFHVNRKALSLYPILASFKDISLKSDFRHVPFINSACKCQLMCNLHCDNRTVYIKNACRLQNTAALKLMSWFLTFSVWSLVFSECI